MHPFIQKNQKILIIFSSIVTVLICVGCYYTFAYTDADKRLRDKSYQFRLDANFEQAIKYYTKLANRINKKASGQGYLGLYSTYEKMEKPEQAAEALMASHEKGDIDALNYLARYWQTGEFGIERSIPKAIEALTKIDDYNSRCDLAKIYMFDPNYIDYDLAVEQIREYIRPHFNREYPRVRHLEAILSILGKGGYKINMGSASGNLKDAESGIAAYYAGNLWLNKLVHNSERFEYCAEQALSYYRSCTAYDNLYVRVSELEPRIEYLTQYLEEYQLANDRSDLYGSDEYYWAGAEDKTWDTAFYLSTRLSYEGRVKNGQPHGTGAGYWQIQKLTFCGQWVNGTPSKGILIMGDSGDIFVGEMKNGSPYRGQYFPVDNLEVRNINP